MTTLAASGLDSRLMYISNNLVINNTGFLLRSSLDVSHTFRSFFNSFLSIPTLLLTVLVLKFINSVVQQNFKGNLQLNTSNYNRLWKFYVVFSKTAQVLREVNSKSLEGLPWNKRIVLRQFIKLSNKLVRLHSMVENKFNQLNKSYSALPDGVSVVSSSDLQHTRMKKYDFLVWCSIVLTIIGKSIIKR